FGSGLAKALVKFDGKAANVLYASDSQLNVAVSGDVQSPSTLMTISANGADAPPRIFPTRARRAHAVRFSDRQSIHLRGYGWHAIQRLCAERRWIGQFMHESGRRRLDRLFLSKWGWSRAVSARLYMVLSGARRVSPARRDAVWPIARNRRYPRGKQLCLESRCAAPKGSTSGRNREWGWLYADHAERGVYQGGASVDQSAVVLDRRGAGQQLRSWPSAGPASDLDSGVGCP